MAAVGTREIDWRTLVIKAEDEATFTRESLYPQVYYWSSDRIHRDSGPNSGIYAGDA
jgi:hypothetical protein